MNNVYERLGPARHSERSLHFILLPNKRGPKGQQYLSVGVYFI